MPPRRQTQAAVVHPYRLAAEDFGRLTEAEFIDAVNELLRLEASACGIPLSGLDLTWKERAPDAGVDASVSNPGRPSDYIPDGLSVWQYKAGTLRPGRVRAEIHSNPPRTRLLGLLQGSAAYNLVLNEDPGATGKALRNEKLRDALSAAGATRDGRVLTGADLAVWTARFPSLVLLTQFHRPVEGLLRFDVWRQSAHHRRPFRSTASQQAIIESFREDLLGTHHGPRRYRITGRSGRGKTRAVLEALDVPELRPRVMYAQDPARLPTKFLAWLRETPQTSAIVVVDECDFTTFERVTEALTGTEGRVVLVAIGPECCRSRSSVDF